MKLILILAAVVALGLTTVLAAPPAGDPATLTLDQADPSLGDTVTFTLGGTHGNKYRIQLIAYGEDLDGNGFPDMIYGADQLADSGFLLGGAGSTWLAQGGPAHLVAKAYYWHGQTWTLDAQLEFEAAG